MTTDNLINKGYNEEPKASVFIDLLQTIVIALAICAVIYLFIATPNEVLGSSMEPTFYEGELLLTNKIIQYMGNTRFVKDYDRGDIVIFHDEFSQEDFIKRVIALPGDKFRIEDNAVYVNDKKLKEEYLDKNEVITGGTFIEDGQTVTVPDGQYIVLGDNRDRSKDSRDSQVGFVKRDHLKGKVFFRYWPLDSFGIIRHYNYGI